MKVLFKTAKMLALGAVAIFMTSCGPDQVEPTDYEGEATIRGIVYINTDQVEDEDDNERAGNATVRVTYSPSDLSVLKDTSSNITTTLTTTTDAEGNFSITVPSSYEGVNYEVSIDQYETEYTIFETEAGTTREVTKTGIFEVNDQDVSAVIGQTVFVEFNFGSDPEFDLSK